MSYEGYIAWRRLSHNGHRDRSEMDPKEQAEWDSRAFKKTEPTASAERAEARRMYLEVTQRQDAS